MPKIRTIDLLLPDDLKTVKQRIEANSRFVGWGLPGQGNTTLIRYWSPRHHYVLSLNDADYRWTPVPNATLNLEATPQGTRVVARVGLPTSLVWASRLLFLTMAPLFIAIALYLVGAGLTVPDVTLWLLTASAVLLSAVGLALNVFGLGYIVYATDRHVDPTASAILELVEAGPTASPVSVAATRSPASSLMV